MIPSHFRRALAAAALAAAAALPAAAQAYPAVPFTISVREIAARSSRLAARKEIAFTARRRCRVGRPKPAVRLKPHPESVAR